MYRANFVLTLTHILNVICVQMDLYESVEGVLIRQRYESIPMVLAP